MTGPLVLPHLADAVVVLRSFEDRDVPLVQRASCDPVIPLITTVPATPDAEAARAYLQRQHARAQDGTYYSFAIADATTDQALGQIGLRAPDAGGRTSTGYWIAAEHRRTGAPASQLGPWPWSPGGRSPWTGSNAWSCTSSRGTKGPGAPRRRSATSEKA